MPHDDSDLVPGGRGRRRVLYVLPVPRFFSQTGGVGGHITHAYGVVDALAQKGYDVDVVAEEDDPVLRQTASRYFELPCPGDGLLKRQIWHNRLVSMLQKSVAAVDYDFIYCRYSVGFSPWLGRLRRGIGGVPLVLEVNSIGSADRAWLGSLEGRALARADLLVCVSRALMRHVEERTGISTKLFLMPNGVRPELFGKPAKPGVGFANNGAIKVGYAGVFKGHCSLDVLHQAVSIARNNGLDLELHLAGDGPLRQTFEKSLFNTEWTFDHGRLEFYQVPDFLAEMDILVFPQSSGHLLGSPVKLFEYMAAGKPVICASLPSVEEVLHHGEYGLLYKPNDARELAGKIIQMAADPERAQGMADMARREVAINHSWQARLETLLAEMTRRGLLPA